MNINFNKWSNILFWWVGLPLLGLISVWCYFNHKNPLDQIAFGLAFMFCVPRIYFKHNELDDKSSGIIRNEFREMTTSEFIEAEVEINRMIPGMQRIKLIEAHQDVYRERFSRHYPDSEKSTKKL